MAFAVIDTVSPVMFAFSISIFADARSILLRRLTSAVAEISILLAPSAAFLILIFSSTLPAGEISVESFLATIFIVPFSSAKFVASVILFDTRLLNTRLATSCWVNVVLLSCHPAIIPAFCAEFPSIVILSP